MEDKKDNEILVECPYCGHEQYAEEGRKEYCERCGREMPIAKEK